MKYTREQIEQLYPTMIDIVRVLFDKNKTYSQKEIDKILGGVK